jgi:hypothetical protein
MSRPQYDRYDTSSSARYAPETNNPYGGTVVNGGLIDFQDNLRRGVSEYLTPQQMIAAGYPQQQMLAAGYPQQQMLAGGYAPNVAQPAVLSQPQQPGQACFSGPPSFIHVNGITYKPVEQEAVAQPQLAPKPAGVDTTAKPLTEDELYHAIDERVSRRVDDYVSSKLRHHPPHHSVRHEAPESPRATVIPVRAEHEPQSRRATGRGGRGQAPMPADDIEAAVQRVLSANASMFTAAPAGKRAAAGGLSW